MKIDEIREHIESRCPERIGTPTNYRESVTGQEYRTYKHDRVYDEGGGIKSWADSEEEAIRVFVFNFVEYLDRRMEGNSMLILYWRIPPQMVTQTIEVNEKGENIELEKPRYFIRCRYLLSDKPPIPKRVESAPYSSGLTEQEKENIKNYPHTMGIKL